MKTITFPLLNLKLNINPIAINIFGISIYWYAIIIVASIILAIFILKLRSGTFNIKYEIILDLAIIAIPIGFIGARIYYVIFNIQEYNYISQILNIRDGGLAIYGGIIAGIIATYIYCKKKKIGFLDILDYISPAIVLAQSIGRWGNFTNIEAYGYNTNLPWKMGIYTRNSIEYVHPTFLYESVATFIIFLILNKLTKNRKFKGEIVYTYLALYSFVRFFIEQLRIDSLMLYNFRISQILSLVIFIYFSTILVKKLKKRQKRYIM